MARKHGNDLALGIMDDRSALVLPADKRAHHLYISGITGVGKSKLLESLILQDILAWQESKCGLLLLDPHGSTYHGIMRWLSAKGHVYHRPVIPIDLTRDDWVIGYNVLRQQQGANPSVIADNMVQAMAYVFGQGDTSQTPRFAQVASTALLALYEMKLTLAEAITFMSPAGRPMREAISARVKDTHLRATLEWLNQLAPREYNEYVQSTLTRLHPFLSNNQMRQMFGQDEIALDLPRAIEEGAIILVNMGFTNNQVSSRNVELFGTLMLNDLWDAAKTREKVKNPKPFYVYLDEFQQFVTPTIATQLDQARGYGLHLTMAQQFPGQLLSRGEDGRRVYDSVMENARNKMIFQHQTVANLKPLAECLFTGMVDPEMVKLVLESTKVMGYREEIRYTESYSETEGWSEAESETSSQGRAAAHMRGLGGRVSSGLLGNEDEDPFSWSEADSESTSDSGGSASSRSESGSVTHGHSAAPMLIPEMGKEKSSVQFYSVEEQQFLHMQEIFKLKPRSAIVRLSGMHVPTTVRTFTVPDVQIQEKDVETFRIKLLKKLPAALVVGEAAARIEQRMQSFNELVIDAREAEPASYKRRTAPPKAAVEKLVKKE